MPKRLADIITSLEANVPFVLYREHPADEVYVTGTFDNWAKSVRLNKVGTAHEKTVELPKSDEKILYKVRSRHWRAQPR